MIPHGGSKGCTQTLSLPCAGERLFPMDSRLFVLNQTSTTLLFLFLHAYVSIVSFYYIWAPSGFTNEIAIFDTLEEIYYWQKIETGYEKLDTTEFIFQSLNSTNMENNNKKKDNHNYSTRVVYLHIILRNGWGTISYLNRLLNP